METLDEVIEVFINIFTVCNLLLYSYIWIHNKKSKQIQFLSLYVLSLFVTHVIVSYTAANGLNNLYVSHYYFGLQFLFLGLFYRTLFLPNQKKWATIIMLAVFTILAIYYILNPEKYYEFNLIDIFITTVPLIIFSIIHLYNMLTKSNRFYTINAGVLIYLSTSTLIFFLGTFLMVEGGLMGFPKQVAVNIWNINNFLYLIFLIFITIEWKITYSKWKTKIK